MRLELRAIAGAIIILAASIYIVGGSERYEFRKVSRGYYIKLDTRTGEVYDCHIDGIEIENDGGLNTGGENLCYSLRNRFYALK